MAVGGRMGLYAGSSVADGGWSFTFITCNSHGCCEYAMP